MPPPFLTPAGPGTRLAKGKPRPNCAECVSNFPRQSAIDGRIFSVDDVDRKILAELQADGRLTLTELADRVRLSVSPCHRRLRTLERSGAIAGYHAQLDASVLGLTFEALVFVTMRYADRQPVAAIPNVLQAQRLFGDPDSLLRVVARDLPAYRQLYDERLATLPGVLRVSSTLVMKSVVDARPLPL